jgi:hypothetical protein
MNLTFCKLIVISVLLASTLPGANQGLVGSGGTPLSTTLPSRTPFTSLSNLRVEFRMSNFTISQTGNQYLFHQDKADCLIIGGGLTLRCHTWRPSNDPVDFNLAGRTDVRIRWQTNVTDKVASIEVWNADGSGYYALSVPMTNTNPMNFSGRLVVWGADQQPSPLANTTLHFIRYYSNTLPLGSAPPADAVTTPADLVSYALDGNLQDQSPSRRNLSGSATYAASPGYAPVAVITATGASGRAGGKLRLRGTSSFASRNVDGVPTGYRWQVISGPAHGLASFANRTAALADFEPPVFGTYNVRLQVVDEAGAEGTAFQEVGAVATDEQERVIHAYPELETLLLPLTLHGSSPWPFFDHNVKRAADILGDGIPNEWEGDVTLPGQVEVTTGSNIIKGTGTSFLSTFACQNGADAIVVHYERPDGTTGRRPLSVLSCTSNTELVIGGHFAIPGVPNGVKTTVPYGKMSSAVAPWINGSDNFNYYDSITAYYRLYLRTGLGRYRDHARKLASIYWNGIFDKGLTCSDIVNFSCSPPRIQAFQGIMLYFLENGASISDWNYLQSVVVWWLQTGYGPNSPPDQLYQIREQGMVFWWCALLAKYHPDPVKRQQMLQHTAYYYAHLRDRQTAEGTWLQNEDGNGYAGLGTLPWHVFSILHGMRVYYEIAEPETKTEIIGVMRKAANFLSDHAYNPVCKGIRYAVLYTRCAGADCGSCPYSGGFISCSGVGDASSCPPNNKQHPTPNRAENEPHMWLWGWLYQVTGEQTWIERGDELFGATYGGGMGGPFDDGGAGTLDDLPRFGLGGRKGKTFGESAGAGAASAYLAWRLGPMPEPNIQEAFVTYKLDSIENATQARVLLLSPSGQQRSFSCEDSPCQVIYDGRQKGHLFKLQFLSESGDVLATSSEWQPLATP